MRSLDKAVVMELGLKTPAFLLGDANVSPARLGCHWRTESHHETSPFSPKKQQSPSLPKDQDVVIYSYLDSMFCVCVFHP